MLRRILLFVPVVIGISNAIVSLYLGYTGYSVGPWGLYLLGGTMLLMSLMYYWLGKAYLGKEIDVSDKILNQPKDDKADNRIAVWCPHETSIRLANAQRSFRSSRCVFKKYIDHTPKLEFLFDPTIRHTPSRFNSLPKRTDFPLEKELIAMIKFLETEHTSGNYRVDEWSVIEVFQDGVVKRIYFNLNTGYSWTTTGEASTLTTREKEIFHTIYQNYDRSRKDSNHKDSLDLLIEEELGDRSNTTAFLS